MIANNIFRAIGDFCTNIIFPQIDKIRFIDNWWLQNTVSWILISIIFIALFYWLGELKKYQNSANE